MLATHRESEGRRDDRRHAGRSPEAARAWASCGSTTRAAWSAFWKSRKTDEELDLVRMDPAWIDAHGIASRGRDCLASMGIYLFNRDTLVDLLTKTDYQRLRQGDLSRVDPHAPRAGAPVRRLLGRHRHDPLVLRGQPGAGAAEPPFRLGTRPIARSTRGPASCPPRGSTAPRSRSSLIADGCVIEPGARDREQRHRPALPHRPRRDDPQFDPDGRRLLRNARRADLAVAAAGPAADGHRRRAR